MITIYQNNIANLYQLKNSIYNHSYLENHLLPLIKEIMVLERLYKDQLLEVFHRMDSNTFISLFVALIFLRKNNIVEIDPTLNGIFLEKLEIAELKKLHLELTYNCNLRCSCCYVYSKINSSINRHMSRNKWELIINEAFELGCNSFVLTGGEPFLNPHFFDILEVLNQKMPYIEINTNGTLINDEVANKLSKYPISSIEVSLYGYDQNSTFEYTKSKSAFKRVFNAISCLKKHNLPFTIKYVQNKFNENGTDHIVQLLREQNIQVKLTGFKLHADVFTGNLNNPQVDIESQHNNILLDEVLPCYPSVNGLALDPEGEVRVCPKIKVLLGNLVNSSLKDIWKKSLELRKFRLFWAYYCAENMMYIGCYQKYICPATQILSKENGLQNFLDEYLKWCNKNDFAKNN